MRQSSTPTDNLPVVAIFVAPVRIPTVSARRPRLGPAEQINSRPTPTQDVDGRRLPGDRVRIRVGRVSRGDESDATRDTGEEADRAQRIDTREQIGVAVFEVRSSCEPVADEHVVEPRGFGEFGRAPKYGRVAERVFVRARLAPSGRVRAERAEHNSED
jgi:hypothetical protein